MNSLIIAQIPTQAGTSSGQYIQPTYPTQGTGQQFPSSLSPSGVYPQTGITQQPGATAGIGGAGTTASGGYTQSGGTAQYPTTQYIPSTEISKCFAKYHL